jgi:MFS family permease
MSRARAAVVVATVAGVSFLNTLGSGLLTVGLPRIAADLELPNNLLLWPASVFALTAGCTLLASGAVADVVGNRPVFLTGCALLTAFTLGSSLSQTGIQLIFFRALQGIALSLYMPTAVSLITNNFPTGRRRNMAFAFLGGGQPIGFALGLVLGGILVDSIGWRFGYYISSAINALIFVGAIFSIPPRTATESHRRRKRLVKDNGWIGVVIASACIAMLSFVFAMITSSTSTIHHPPNIALLAIAGALMPSFVFWVGGKRSWETGHHPQLHLAEDRVHQHLRHRLLMLGPIQCFRVLRSHFSSRTSSISPPRRPRSASFPSWWSASERT